VENRIPSVAKIIRVEGTTSTTVPATPIGLTATAAGTQINLAWTDNANNETGFEIERSPDGAAFAQIATVGVNVSSYANTGLTAGTTYHYRVRSTNSAGDSAVSNVVSATLLS
jgi:titin